MTPPTPAGRAPSAPAQMRAELVEARGDGPSTGSRRIQSGLRLRAWAAALGGLVLLEVVAATVLAMMAGWSWQDALDAFVVTNSAIGLSFGVCGAILAWHRPHNPIGWLFVAGVWRR